jgi:hypothetical protein
LLGVLGGEKACRGPEGNRSRIRRRMSCRDKPFSGFTGKDAIDHGPRNVMWSWASIHLLYVQLVPLRNIINLMFLTGSST